MKKRCLQCGCEFEKPSNESLFNWYNRHRFCSKKCKAEFQRQEMIGNQRGFKKGQSVWNKGKSGEYHLPPLTKEHKEKLAISKLGEKNPSWCGGMSKPQPYTTDWTMTLKRSIRERDNYTCGICKRQQEDTTFAVHHIDYVKENCNPTNLITLCPSCHSKTNMNRSFWIEFFKKQTTIA